MSGEIVEVFVRGPAAALDAVALGLLSAGANVHSPDASPKRVDPPAALKGMRAVVRMASAADAARPQHDVPSTVNLASAARACTGAVMLLALFGAELRLHFGPKLETVVSLAAVWAFWRLCLRSGAATV